MKKSYKISNQNPASKGCEYSSSSFFRPVVQPRLTINPPNDRYEQEADAVAAKVMRMQEANEGSTFFKPTSITGLQRKCTECGENEKLQLKRDASGIGGVAAPDTVHDVIGSGGQALDSHTKSFMESGFGYDFGNVRVHNDAIANKSSADINALAYTHGNHVVFGAGQYRPDDKAGKHLLAHELAHVVQQRKNSVSRKHRDTAMTVTGHRQDGIYDLDFGYQLEITANQATIILNIKIVPDTGVTSDEVKNVKAWTNREFLRYFDGRFTLRDPDGEIIPLRMKLNFVETGEDAAIALHKGSSEKRTVSKNTVTITNETEDQLNWFVESDPIVRAHELGHQLGLFDEYFDPSSPNRNEVNGPGVFYDNSLMVAGGGSMDSDMADVRYRHGDRIANDISKATDTEYLVGWSDTYIVRSGDTMKRIAKRIYGDENKWRDIYEMNKTKIENYRLKRNQVLKLPSRY